MLLDTYIPTYQFHTNHQIEIQASPGSVMRAIKEISASDIPFFRLLFGIRSLPAYLMGRGNPYRRSNEPTLHEAMQAGGFVKLAEEEDRELVVGAIGKWWIPQGAEFYPIADARNFLLFEQPGYAVAALNFFLDSGDKFGPVSLQHETRVYAPDPATHRRFGIYWTLIYPGVFLIRRAWLWAIKQRAERNEFGGER